MHESATKRLLAFIVFLVVSSLMIALPLVVVLVRPQQAQGILGKVNRWIDGSLKYVVACVFGIGLYFIARGVAGIVRVFQCVEWLRTISDDHERLRYRSRNRQRCFALRDINLNILE